MSVKEQLAQQEAAEAASGMLQSLNSMQSQLNELTGKVAEVVTSQNSAVQAVHALTLSQTPGTSFSQQQNAEMQSVNETLSLIAEQLSSSEAVKLPDGQTVRRSDLDALSLSRETNEKLVTMASAFEQLAKAVRAKSTVNLDADKVAAVMTGRVSEAIKEQMNANEKSVEALFAAHEERLAALTRTATADAVEQQRAADKIVVDTERHVKGLQKALTWHGVGNVALALVPFAVVALVLGSLLGMFANVLGVGPLFGWAWDSFYAAEHWWQKGLIAVATLTGAGACAWLIKVAVGKIADTYKGW